MTASERIRNLREAQSANTADVREEQRADHIRRELATLRVPANSIHRHGSPRRFTPGMS